jgi:hypothetical protein
MSFLLNLKTTVEPLTPNILDDFVKGRSLNMSRIRKPQEQEPHPNISIVYEKPRVNNRCSCVHCCRNRCGHLWLASARQNVIETTQIGEIDLVISHCMHNLSWIEGFFSGYNISSIIVYSKCGKEAIGAPKGAKVIRLENVGRNDHTFAYHIANELYNVNMTNRITFFLKDNRLSAEQRGGKWRSIDELLRITSSFNFACALELNVYRKYSVILASGLAKFSVSAFHRKTFIHKFGMSGYATKANTYENLTEISNETFTSSFKDLEEWMKSIPFSFPPCPLVQVCYGGSFVATTDAILKHPLELWKSLERSLSRANNIEEGHFIERSWAGLLSKPLNNQQAVAVIKYATSIAKKYYLRGALVHRLESVAPERTYYTQWESCVRASEPDSVQLN